jgi:hypothetical protein
MKIYIDDDGGGLCPLRPKLVYQTLRKIRDYLDLFRMLLQDTRYIKYAEHK